MIKAVIFDLDGTLLYTLDSISLSCNKVLEAHRLPPVTHEQLKHFVGDGVIDLMRRAFCAGMSEETVDENIVAEFRAHFKEDCDYHVKPYEGIPALIRWLKEKGILVACNTNKPHENAVNTAIDKIPTSNLKYFILNSDPYSHTILIVYNIDVISSTR